MSRPKGAHEPVPVPCVGAVIHDERGRVLLVRRAHEPGAGLWSVPGGRIEASESAMQAVAREVREETGLTVSVGQRLGQVLRPGPENTLFVIEDFACQVSTDPGMPASAAALSAGDDATAAAWFTRRQLRQLPQVSGLWQALDDWEVLPEEGPQQESKEGSQQPEEG